MKNAILLLGFIMAMTVAQAQVTKLTFPLTDTGKLQVHNVAVTTESFKNKRSVKVVDLDPEKETELRIAKLAGSSFHNGTIEVELAGAPMKNSSESARGFVGIAFRIDQADSRYECIYLRPTNGRADDQVRRNHSVQYISYPEFPWHKLREQFPKKYETYVDLEVATWTKIKIEVKGSSARLFVHDAHQPTLIVSDLKHGENLEGGIGLWIGPGTEAHFRNLVVRKQD